MRKTTSLCPVCLRRIPALRRFENGAWYQHKTCPAHGDFSTVIWRGSEDMDAWVGDLPENGAEEGLRCPDDCGLCEKHLRNTCCTLLEITDRCNMSCRFCFADPSARPDLSLDTVKAQIDEILHETNGTLLQLSGGEPTVREDLPEIIAYAKEAGCRYIQLNTNGLRLAGDPAYARTLAQAGLSFVFLQFDGVSNDVYRALRGRSMLGVKEKVIRNCARAGLGVTLVPVIVPEVNTEQIGDILRFAIAHSPTVRGVHFQPVSYFGRIPALPTDAQRYTLGELIDDIVRQTGGLIPRESLVPSACDHPLCGLHGDYIVMPGGKLEVLSRRGVKAECSCHADPAEQNREYIGSRWQRTDEVKEPAPSCCCCGEETHSSNEEETDIHSLDGFLKRKKSHGFTVTAMAFQDAGNLDLERLRQCSLHVFRDGKRIPFCAAYLSKFENTGGTSHDDRSRRQ